MKKIFKYKLVGALLVSFLMLSSCDSFLDVNKDPNKQTDPTLSTLTSSAIIKTADLQYSFSYYANRYAQNSSGTGASATDQYANNTMSSAWYNLYTGALADLDELKKLSEETEAYHFLGVAEILLAADLGAATDVWDAIPYSDALNGNENYLPAFDTQEEIYAEIYSLLDDAIVNLQKTDVYFDFSTISGDFDLLYDGDATKWLQLAYAYKARYLNHWSGNAAEIRTAVANSLTSYGDDANFYYNEQNHSPYYSIALSNITGNLSITFSDYIIQTLNGDLYGAMDPRFTIIADTVSFPPDGGYNGVYTGQIAGGPTRPTDLTFTQNCWHFGIESPTKIMTYAEQQFILAEVEVNAGNQTAAYTAWENGVRANMGDLGVASADIDTYISDSGVDGTSITIADVMKEKYIALFMQPESWVDMRRYDYGDGNSAYPGFAKPIDIDPEIGGAWVRRVTYPLTEQNRNGTNVDAAKGSNYGMAKPVTWNQ